VLQNTVVYVVNLVKLFAYCCKNFRSAGRKTTVQPGPEQAMARPAGRVGVGLVARPARAHLYSATAKSGCK